MELGCAFKHPVPTTCLDEVLIIIRRSKNLSFDADLPSFHLYGTDIVHTARNVGLRSYIIHAPLVHNTQMVQSLDGGYTEAYKYMQLKLSHELPIRTLISEIDEFGMGLHKANNYIKKRAWRRRLSRLKRMAFMDWRWLLRRPAPRTIAESLGFE
jgi:hypothetical protein